MNERLLPDTALATSALVLGNARVVLDHDVVAGEVAIDGGLVVSGPGETAPGGAVLDCEGDYLLPGLIDLHTDNIEHHFFPRPAVHWPSALAAVMAHDWQMLGAGITTVLDSLSIGDYDSRGSRAAMLRSAIDGVTAAREAGLTHADHYFHFRCELSDPLLLTIVEPHLGNPALKLLSLMDHTPGQRQWRDTAIYRRYNREKKGQVWTETEFASYLAERQEMRDAHSPASRKRITEAARTRGIPLASHDDTTIADVDESFADGITLSEFPTTVDAAAHARSRGMDIVMGSPNVVLGGSHSGNASAAALADMGLLDILTSDYVPSSLLHAAFLLAERGLGLPAAVATVTSKPAKLLGFTDRGRIAPGLRADLLRVRVVDGVPVIRGIWVKGRRYL
jgi:alpha-D-ribose 1-methylphosphonate 5-triphosphate diphosphatase